MSYPRTLTFREILEEVDTELAKAVGQHGPMQSRHEAYAVLLEEVDEYWDEVKLNPRKMSLEDHTAWLKRQRKELLQIAAMAIRAIVDTIPLNYPTDAQA